MNSATETVRARLNETAAALRKQLDVGVLCGTPMMLIAVGNPEFPGEMVYGRWDPVREGSPCWRPLEAIDHHFSGVRMLSPASAEECVDAMNRNPVAAGVRYFARHRRNELANRLGRVEALLLSVKHGAEVPAEALLGA